MNTRKLAAIEFCEKLPGNNYKIAKATDGINSDVYFVYCNDHPDLVLKLYKLPTLEDPRNRFQAEKNFLEYCKAVSIKNVPKLIYSDDKNLFLIMSKELGSHPVSIDKLEILSMTDFLFRLNKYKYTDVARAISFGSEACQSYRSYLDSVNQKFNKIKLLIKDKNFSHPDYEFLTDTIEPQLRHEQSMIISRSSKLHWKVNTICSTLSPSDIGIHNMLKTDSGIIFYDFEYAGWDDCSKMFGDIILNPNHSLSCESIELLLKNLLNPSISADDSWVERFNDIKTLLIINWSLILFKIKLLSNSSSNQFQSPQSYYAHAHSRYFL